jgi:hypothetical protein
MVCCFGAVASSTMQRGTTGGFVDAAERRDRSGGSNHWRVAQDLAT